MILASGPGRSDNAVVPCRKRPRWLAGALLPVSMLLGPLVPARALHAPHDVSRQVVVSPAYASDATVLAVVELTDHPLLTASTDGGRSWTTYAAPIQRLGTVRLCYSPAFARDRSLFAATNGGVWMSTDGGLTWEPRNGEPRNGQLPTAIITDVAISPGFASDHLVLASTPVGVFRSTDAGLSWHSAPVGLVETGLKRVVFAPDGGDVVFVAGHVLHRSDDGGQTWVPQQGFDDEVASVAVAPDFQRSGTLAVSFGRFGGGVMVGSVGGTVWMAASDGLIDPDVNQVAIAADGTTFAVAATGGCCRASAPGARWTAFAEGFEELTSQTENHFLSVAPSPDYASDGTVYVAAFEGVFRSMDGGETWTQLDVYSQKLSRGLAVSPEYDHDGLLFAANFGGGPFVHREQLPWQPAPVADPAPDSGPAAPDASVADSLPFSPIPPAGPTSAWRAHANGLATLYGSALALSPDFGSDHTLFHAYVGLWRSVDTGQSWELLDAPLVIPRSVTLSPAYASDRTLFIGSDHEGTFRSQDGGDSWVELTGGLPASILTTRIVLSPGYPTDPVVMVATAHWGVWRSSDGGGRWLPSKGLAVDRVRALALSPEFELDHVALCGTVGGGLYRSTDSGVSWRPENTGLPWGAQATIEAVVFSPAFAADMTAFAVDAYEGVYRSVDGGRSWQDASAGLPVGAPRGLVISPNYRNDHTLFLSTHQWIWRSRDGGESWQRLSDYTRVDERHPTVRRAGDWQSHGLAGSHGAGMQEALVIGDWQELEFEGRDITWYAVRSPTSGQARVELDGEHAAFVDLRAASVEPQQAVFTHEFGAVGWHTIRVSVASSGGVASDGFEYTY